MSEELEVRASEFVTQSCGGKINVDWSEIAKFQDRLGYSGRKAFEQLRENVLEYLLQRGFLTLEGAPGAFVIMQSNFPANPRSSYGMRYDFKDKKEAEKYVKAFFQDQDKIDICQNQ
jgi:hypothetical protein